MKVKHLKTWLEVNGVDNECDIHLMSEFEDADGKVQINEKVKDFAHVKGKYIVMIGYEFPPNIKAKP